MGLFAIYLLLLIGLILFKFPFNYVTSNSGRELNLIPLAGSFSSDGVFRWSEVIENIIVFVPFGIYISTLRSDWSFGRKILPIIITTVVFEAIQYIFAIGRTDITDVLGNTLGGAIGIGIQLALARSLGRRAERVISAVALILTIGAGLLWAFLALHSSGARAHAH